MGSPCKGNGDQTSSAAASPDVRQCFQLWRRRLLPWDNATVLKVVNFPKAEQHFVVEFSSNLDIDAVDGRELATFLNQAQRVGEILGAR